MQLTSCTRHADAQLLLWPVRLKLILGQLGTLIYVLYGVRHAEVQLVRCPVVTGTTRNGAKLQQWQDVVERLSKVEDGTFCAAQAACGLDLSSTEVGFPAMIGPL